MSEFTSYEEQLQAGESLTCFTVGNSMEPLLYNRSTHVFIKKAEGDLRRNDIPLYKRPSGQYVMHRVIRVSKDHYYTRGDNRGYLEKVPKAWVLGVVTKIYRKGKYISITDPGYRLYVFLWNLIYPFRRVYYSIKARLKCRKGNGSLS